MTPSFIGPDGGIRADHRAARLVERAIAGAGSAGDLVSRLRRHELAPGAVDALVRARRPELAQADAWEEAVAANRSKADRLTRARALAEAALAPVAERVAIPPSMLGPLWGHDVDILVAQADLREAGRALVATGLLDVNPLLERIGRVTPGVRRYGAVDDGEVLASVELCIRLHQLGPLAGPAIARAEHTEGGLPRLSPADATLRRCLKVSAGRRVSARSVLELLALVELLPAPPPSRDIAIAFHRCAELERELDGPGPLSEIAQALPRPRNWRYGPARLDGVGRAARRRVRPRRLRVAFSGIDGAGKSTQAALLTDQLKRLDVPSTTVWVRIGFSGSGLFHRFTAFAQRLMPRGSHSAQTDRATGAPQAGHATRRGVLGWSWALAVTLNYIWWLQRLGRRPRGAVVVHDRGLVDALIGLELGYGGNLDLSLQRWLVIRFGPKADRTFYLRIPASVAQERKDDMFVREVLEAHVEHYDRMAEELPGVVTLDASADPAELGREALQATLEAPNWSGRGLGVALLAPDGAGKSTLAEALKRALPTPVWTVHMELYARGVSGPRIPGVGLVTRLARQWRRYARARVHEARGRMVVFDRYPYDALLPGPGQPGRVDRVARWLLARAVPAPDLAIVLDVPAETLLARKDEHPLERLEEQRHGYLELAGRLPCRSVVVDGSREPDEVLREVEGHIARAYRDRRSGGA